MTKRQSVAAGPVRWSREWFLFLGAPIMAVLWIGGTLLAVVLYPSFSWTSNTLAEVGSAGQPTAPILDGSLFVGSLFGVLFLYRVSKEKSTRLQHSGLLLMSALIFLVGIGQLGVQQPWLAVIVLSFIFLLPIGFAVYGSSEVFAENTHLGVLSFWLGLIHLLAWDIVSNVANLSSAVPTFISFIVISVWMVSLYVSLRS